MIKSKFNIPITVLFAVATLSGCQKQHENSERIAKKANQRNFETNASEKEAEFVVETISENFANLEFTQLAEVRSENAEIKEVAALIDRDQSRLIRELKGFANMRGITIPLEENIQARRKLADMEETEDKSFDEKWLANRHEKSIEELESMWEKSNDEELKTWINSALPGLRTSLVKLNACHEKLTM
jgi:putative membrane protein